MQLDKKEEILQFIRLNIAKEVGIDPKGISQEHSFFELGLDSISAVYLMELVEREFDITLSPLDFWDYPTLTTFCQHILTNKLP